MRARLPDSLVPSRVIPILQLPLTPGGKLLRSALPPPPSAVGYPPAGADGGAMAEGGARAMGALAGGASAGAALAGCALAGVRAAVSGVCGHALAGGGVALDSPAAGLVTHTERLVAAAWEAELQLEIGSVGPGANFFSLGGTSTAAVRVLRRLAPDLGGERGETEEGLGDEDGGLGIGGRRGGRRGVILHGEDYGVGKWDSGAGAVLRCLEGQRFGGVR